MDIFRVNESFKYLKRFLVNPFNTIKNVPPWNISEIFAFQISISLLLGLLASLFSRTYINLILFPLSSLVITFVGALLFFFLLSAIFTREFNFYKIYMIVFLSHLPFLFLRVFKFWVAPVELIGFAATTILLTVGFVENFYLPKRKLIMIFGSVYAVYFVVWMSTQIYTQKTTLDLKRRLQTEEFKSEDSVEKIKEELSNP